MGLRRGRGTVTESRIRKSGLLGALVYFQIPRKLRAGKKLTMESMAIGGELRHCGRKREGAECILWGRTMGAYCILSGVETCKVKFSCCLVSGD